MEEMLNLKYSSNLSELREINSSFDLGVLRICYAGDNRNGTTIPKDVIDKSIPTLYNCPIVCNYDRNEDRIGGHDIELVTDEANRLHIVNLTMPVGVIPESSNVYWKEHVDEDGVTREYLFAEALIWKRQEAYEKIKRDGVTAQSMEIKIKDGEKQDGFYRINDFEFNAFALIGIEPCFEGAALEMFSNNSFESLYSNMMADFDKEKSAPIDKTNSDDIDIESGKEEVDSNMDIEKETEYVKEEEIDEETDEVLEEETQEEEEEEPKDDFSLNGNILDELLSSLNSQKAEFPWGTDSRYWFYDFDLELKEVYVTDMTDNKLYGFPFDIIGDAVKIDFNNKKRKKFIVVDFEGEELEDPAPTSVYENKKLSNENEEIKKLYELALEQLEELKKFKENTESEKLKEEKMKVFSEFDDIAHIDEYQLLMGNLTEYDIDSLKKELFAIRGKQVVVTNYSLKDKTPILKVQREVLENEPYGGIISKYIK